MADRRGAKSSVPAKKARRSLGLAKNRSSRGAGDAENVQENVGEASLEQQPESEANESEMDSQSYKMKSKQSSNWSTREQYILVSSYIDQMDILSADHSGSGGQQKEKKRIFEEILAAVNA